MAGYTPAIFPALSWSEPAVSSTLGQMMDKTDFNNDTPQFLTVANQSDTMNFVQGNQTEGQE